jgi:hypothetical protein
MSTIHFKTKLFKINRYTILQIPESESIKLPSRGQVMVKGTINGTPIHTALEPDGKWSHWLKVDEAMGRAIGAGAGDSVEVAIESTKDWPEPDIPEDLQVALDADVQAYDFWKAVTTMARWEWIRWINGTKSSETRAKRIRVSLSKLKAGEKRPCCFNRAMCTDPYVSKGGKLLDSA